MRILLAQNMPYVPAHGGANRSNRVLLEQVAADGHQVEAVAALAASVPVTAEAVVAVGGEVVEAVQDRLRFRLRGVQVDAVPGHRLVPTLRAAVGNGPDRVLVPSDDPGWMVLAAALALAPDRVVYLAHTIQRLPFGPQAFHPAPAGTRLLGRARQVVAVSRTIQQYLRRWGGLGSELLYPHVYGEGPWPAPSPGASAVTLVNACGYKGIDVFLGLADRFPQQPFLAVAGWGTKSGDRQALAGRANVEVVEAGEGLDAVWARTRLLLAPSLWTETFGYTVVEAMLRGIPVLAARLGGLVEAGLGVAPLLPVEGVAQYRPDDPLHPSPVLPVQDLRPWAQALEQGLDLSRYGRWSADGRRAAEAFVAGLDRHGLHRILTAPVPSGQTG